MIIYTGELFDESFCSSLPFFLLSLSIYTSFFLASYRGFSFLKPYSQNFVLGFT